MMTCHPAGVPEPTELLGWDDAAVADSGRLFSGDALPGREAHQKLRCHAAQSRRHCLQTGSGGDALQTASLISHLQRRSRRHRCS